MKKQIRDLFDSQDAANTPVASTRIWKCEICGAESVWGDGWRHYGSIRNDEAGMMPIIACSQRCADSEKIGFLIAEYVLVEEAMKSAGLLRWR